MGDVMIATSIMYDCIRMAYIWEKKSISLCKLKNYKIVEKVSERVFSWENRNSDQQFGEYDSIFVRMELVQQQSTQLKLD